MGGGRKKKSICHENSRKSLTSLFTIHYIASSLLCSELDARPSWPGKHMTSMNLRQFSVLFPFPNPSRLLFPGARSLFMETENCGLLWSTQLHSRTFRMSTMCSSSSLTVLFSFNAWSGILQLCQLFHVLNSHCVLISLTGWRLYFSSVFCVF